MNPVRPVFFPPRKALSFLSESSGENYFPLCHSLQFQPWTRAAPTGRGTRAPTCPRCTKSTHGYLLPSRQPVIVRYFFTAAWRQDRAKPRQKTLFGSNSRLLSVRFRTNGPWGPPLQLHPFPPCLSTPTPAKISKQLGSVWNQRLPLNQTASVGGPPAISLSHLCVVMIATSLPFKA